MAAAKIANAFEWPGQPPKLPLPLDGSAPPSNHGSLGPSESLSKKPCRSVQPFLPHDAAMLARSWES